MTGTRILRSERGLTLTEITIVTVLASLVMIGLVSFYLSSQATWVDASTQAITQREGTHVIEVITQHARFGEKAFVFPSPDHSPQNMAYGQLQIAQPQGRTATIWWKDSTLYLEDDPTKPPRPLIVASKVDTFEVDKSDSLVFIRNLVLLSPNGQRLRLSSTAMLYNCKP
jgi:hypothetical protein